MRRQLWTRFGLALAALLLIPALASAQATQVGQLAGDVKDITGGVLPGATVTLTSVERGFTRSMVTDAEGKFLFPVLPIGRYTVTVQLSSFATSTISDNLVEAERTTRIAVTLKVAGLETATTVVGETPIVDVKNQTQETRVRAEEFSKLAVGRSYQSLMAQAPGVVGTGNVNSHGSLSSSNIFMFDGVNTTDPTTGTFGSNLNFEAIQEVVIRTSTVGVEYGGGTGAIVDVITKSGTNRFEGSMKWIGTNDNWNEQNTTKNEVTGASLARTKYDKVNSVYSGTIGGPVVKDRAWFFFAYEDSRNTTPQRQTNAATGFSAENYQQTTVSQFWTVRGTAQLATNHNVWFKYTESPTEGFIVDYWGASAELYALTAQNQGGSNYAAQYNGVIGSKWTATFMAAHAPSFIDVVPYKTGGALLGGAPFYDQLDGRFYNGATFDGTVDRPRTQASGAMEYFTTLGGNSHAIKFGGDWQDMKSTNYFRYPTNQLYYVRGFNPNTRAYTPDFYEEYQDAPSTSNGTQLAFYVRDKFQVGSRLNLEFGLRVDKQDGTSDVGAGTVDTIDWSPRFSGSYSVTSDNKTVILGSYGRFLDNILQNFSDAFGNVPQQTNYKSYLWNGSAYVFDYEYTAAGSNFKPNLGISPRHMDEFTIGMQQQLNNTLGVGARYIQREWGNFIDDVYTFNADNTVNREVVNLDTAERSYKGFELTVDRRFANNWSASGSYTYSQTRGNHFGADFTALGDYVDATCRQTTDAGLGGLDGTFPCSDLQANLRGNPAFDRPHLVKFAASYRKPLGPIDLTAGVVGNGTSKTTYSKTRVVNVLRPGTTSSQTTQTYNYEGLGSERVDGYYFLTDLSIEATYRMAGRSDVGVKFETFNLFNTEEKIGVNNTTWCEANISTSCQTARTNFGTATTRDRFATPRTYRFTVLFRF
jgi:outer membrane receptor protein involved in Fe transport